MRKDRSGYIENLALERLIYPGVVPEDFNENVVGRILDRINRFGSTILFNRIAMKCMQQLSFSTHLYHVDTTSFGVHGEYEGPDCKSAIEITLGHPKDGRWDLKQFILSMVTNQCGIPLFVQAHSGNKSDKKTLIETIQMFKSNLDFTEKSYFVADSAFFSSKNIGLLGDRTLWITRVPSTVREVKDFQSRDLEMRTCSDDRYSIFETEINYGGIDLKFIVVDSREMHASKAKTFDRRIDKEFTQARKSLKKLGNVVFACEADARKAVDRWISEKPHFILKGLNICVISKRIGSKRGRPKKDETLEKGYLIEAEVERNEEIIANERARLGSLSWQAMIRPSMVN